jgi:hypothetical protein
MHYHIHWKDSKLDWEAFPTQKAAEMGALALARPDETYVIEQFDGDCPTCDNLSKRARSVGKRLATQ